MSGKHPSQKKNSTSPPPPPLSLPQIVGIEVKRVSNATLFTTLFASTTANQYRRRVNFLFPLSPPQKACRIPLFTYTLLMLPKWAFQLSSLCYLFFNFCPNAVQT